jgi:uncharacterized protein (TIGR03437 family)
LEESVLRFFLAAAFVSVAYPASLSVSTYLKDGFTPAASAADSQGNIYIAGSATIDAASRTTGALVAKLDPKASQFLYLAYLDSAASDTIGGITIDGAGNAYVVGTTSNPLFPAVGGGSLGTAPSGGNDTRTFVTKLNPQGAVVFSVLVGGAVSSNGRGIALTPQGQIVVSGIANASGFPVTSGAYTVSDSKGRWFVLELDASATAMIFSATGIGGSAIALDGAGNIYLAGSSVGTDYPTTPGAYQNSFTQGFYCFGLCQISFPGNLQHVTKIDPAGTTLIYSTGLNDTKGGAGSTDNTGIAVDSAGNAYVTGTLFEASFPFTVTPPSTNAGFLSKLDAAGAKLVFSIPVGGNGVQLDSSGAVYVGGSVPTAITGINIPPLPPVPFPPEFSNLPAVCQPNRITATNGAYAVKVDGASGKVLDSQWIDGSSASAAAVVLTGGKLWITGSTQVADVPFTPGATAATHLVPGPLQGAWLSAVDFSPVSTAAPAIACVLDSGNLTHIGAVSGFQLISIFGSNLGIAAGVAALDPGGDLSLGGVSITFDGQPAKLLYVSASQINVVVPLPPPSREVVALPTFTVMQVNVNDTIVRRGFPYTVTNLNVFADLSTNILPCPGLGNLGGFQPVANNADGSINSCANPAKYGSTVSFYAHGVGAFQLGFPPVPELLNVQAFVGNCSAPVTKAALSTDYVYKLDVTLPATQTPCGQNIGPRTENVFSVTFSYNGLPVGPLVVPVPGSLFMGQPGQAMPMTVWVTQ